jgi:hypothetical protein
VIFYSYVSLPEGKLTGKAFIFGTLKALDSMMKQLTKATTVDLTC